jgi:8-oxo-dGTP pyrophosphatase MutT (NUDIX family)
MGRYNKSDNKYIQHLLNNMSYSEKIDIISMQFSQMWYRIWLNNPERSFNITDIYRDNNFSRTVIENKYNNIETYRSYTDKKNKFESNFLKDKGERLRNLIQQSSDSEILWEIPKGGKQYNKCADSWKFNGSEVNKLNKFNSPEVNKLNKFSGPEVNKLNKVNSPEVNKLNKVFKKSKEETDLDCAIREFTEETSVPSNKYKILFDIDPIIDNYVDNDINYRTIYFIAALKPEHNDFKPYIDFRNFNQITEIEQIKWVSMSEIEFFCLNKDLHKRLINLYSNIIKAFKKSNKIKKLVY